MTRMLFGGGPEDVYLVDSVDNNLQPGPGATVLFYTAETGSTMITDLLDINLTPITGVVTSDGTDGRAPGQIKPFYGPDGVFEMWASASGSPRFLMQTSNLGSYVGPTKDALTSHEAQANGHSTHTRDLLDVSSTAPTNGQYLAYNTTGGQYVPASLPAPPTIPTVTGPPVVQVFAASGTWTKPSNCLKVQVQLVGGGGAGGGAGTTGASQWSFGDGGGGGEYANGMFDATALTSTVAVTVGAGGTATTGFGNAGGTSSFGTYMTAIGGNAGAVRTATSSANFSPNTTSRAGGSGGTGGNYHAPGGLGGSGIGVSSNAGTAQRGGDGGASFFAGGQYGNSNAGGSAGRSYGGGGSGASLGASQTAVAGGSGAAGIAIVTSWSAV